MHKYKHWRVNRESIICRCYYSNYYFQFLFKWLASPDLLQVILVPQTIDVTRILSGGALFLAKKLTTFFYSRCTQRPSKYTSKSNSPSKNCPKNWLLLWLGVHFVSWGVHLHIFPVNYAWKKFFSPPWGVQVHPLHPLATHMPQTSRVVPLGIITARYLTGQTVLLHHETMNLNKTRLWRRLWSESGSDEMGSWHGRLQDFFPGLGKFTGIARIFSGDALFFLKKLTTSFLVVPSKHRLKLLNEPLRPYKKLWK